MILAIEVDNTEPEVEIMRPLQGAVISGSVEVEVSLEDKHLTHYVLEYGRIRKE
jgi:hypothetical protein